MSYDVSNPFLAENEYFSNKDFEQFMLTFQSKYNDLLQAVNKKDYGNYQNIELMCGQQRFDRADAQNIKDIVRIVVDCGALPNNALKQVAHGMDFSTAEFTRIYGVATRTGVSGIPLPYMSANPIYLDVDATNVNITTTNDKTAYTISTVTIEYVR